MPFFALVTGQESDPRYDSQRIVLPSNEKEVNT
jgi:hypothetical protein